MEKKLDLTFSCSARLLSVYIRSIALNNSSLVVEEIIKNSKKSPRERKKQQQKKTQKETKKNNGQVRQIFGGYFVHSLVKVFLSVQ